MTTPKKPDRYTRITCHSSELKEKIDHINALDLKWFARSDHGNRSTVLLYVFFDELGLQKYLNNEWGNRLDIVGEWVEELKQDKITDVVFSTRVLELFED